MWTSHGWAKKKMNNLWTIHEQVTSHEQVSSHEQVTSHKQVTSLKQVISKSWTSNEQVIKQVMNNS